MASFESQKGDGVLGHLIRTIQANASMLSEIDGAIGDGDHGINMDKGFTLFARSIAEKNVDLSDGLKNLGTILLTEIGGSMGPLYGTFFLEMAKASKGKERIDKEVFGAMLDNALDGVRNLGKAKVGDKTLLDSLVPATEAYRASLKKGKTFTEALVEMKNAAARGKESTRNMIAKVGRSSRLGERSRGVLDAGAVSCWLILQSDGERNPSRE